MDEEFAFVLQSLKEKDFEIGELKSEIAHLASEYTKLKSLNSMEGVNRLTNDLEKKQTEILGLNAQLKMLRSKIK